jgi:hypothetical protein
MTDFFSLSAELRLHIAGYALEQPDDVAENPMHVISYRPRKYRASWNLSILLVCRQFHEDFAAIAVQKTTFRPNRKAITTFGEEPATRLKNIRKLVIDPEYVPLADWQTYPFNNENLRLDKLTIVSTEALHDILPGLMRRLQHVKKIRMVLDCGREESGLLLDKLLGAIYKEDHYQRYDAPGAPNLGSVSFELYTRGKYQIHDFVAKKPEPMLATEEDYMVMMKPKIDKLMMD